MSSTSQPNPFSALSSTSIVYHARMNPDIEIRASSKSLNLTIKEIDALIDGKPISTNGLLRTQLHDKLFKLLQKEARVWYGIGFKRGHKRCRELVKRVPRKITKDMRIRTRYLPNEVVRVALKSVIKD